VKVFEFMDAEKANFEITRMARLSEVSRSGYYAWRDRDEHPGPREERRAKLAEKIKFFHDESDNVNGAPRILADLRDDGEVVSRKTVAKIMRNEGIVGISPATWHPTTTIPDGGHTIPDLVKRRFDQGALDLVWTSDITYLKTGEGWLYLCAVRDGHSRKVLGWCIEDHMHTDLVDAAVRSAVVMRGGDVTGTIFHADRGTQYTSTQMAETAAELGLRLSVGRTGVCWDNSQIESFWSTLKSEFYDRYSFATKTEAKQAVGAWIESVYNRRRRHSKLGMTNPVAFEQHINNVALAA
jgi:putative transposase